jgi:hypothetical protein
LGVLSIGTIDVIYSTTEAKAFASVGNLLGKEPLLSELNTVIVVEVVWIAGGVISDARPATNIDSAEWIN